MNVFRPFVTAKYSSSACYPQKDLSPQDLRFIIKEMHVYVGHGTQEMIGGLTKWKPSCGLKQIRRTVTQQICRRTIQRMSEIKTIVDSCFQKSNIL